uniref:Uncharacterized protein n=1 Tax=Esox lucius TaxID=8010 RepID=A0A3P8ZL58_ESOLU
MEWVELQQLAPHDKIMWRNMIGFCYYFKLFLNKLFIHLLFFAEIIVVAFTVGLVFTLMFVVCLLSYIYRVLWTLRHLLFTVGFFLPG